MIGKKERTIGGTRVRSVVFQRAANDGTLVTEACFYLGNRTTLIVVLVADKESYDENPDNVKNALGRVRLGPPRFKNAERPAPRRKKTR